MQVFCLGSRHDAETQAFAVGLPCIFKLHCCIHDLLTDWFVFLLRLGILSAAGVCSFLGPTARSTHARVELRLRDSSPASGLRDNHTERPLE